MSSLQIAMILRDKQKRILFLDLLLPDILLKKIEAVLASMKLSKPKISLIQLKGNYLLN